MKPTRKRLVAAAAALSTIAIAAPVATAGAATDPVAGQAALITGPVIITTASTSFVNTNNQVSAGGNWSGGQSAP